jgi:cellulose biosynthesis protein BcsQ
MEWHIITGSKGGVGKTLLTLLLLAYHLEEKTNEGILVLDLNAVNTDTAAILRYGSNFAETIDITLNTLEPRIITLQNVSYKVYSQQNPFAVGCTVNPFLLYKHDDFAGLLFRIKAHAKIIADELGISPLQHVIIDTNYHFCNLFPLQDEQYHKYKESCADDHFNIWFLWVYRQLKKILDKRDSEIDTIIKTAGAIERTFKQNMGPIIHTYTPLGLLPTDSKKGSIFGFGKENLPNRNEDYVIDELRKLEGLEKVGRYIRFNQWIKRLQNAQRDVLHQAKIDDKDTHRLFSATLYEAVQELAEEEFLPINIFPFSIYQPALEGYTDRERDNTVAQLRELDTYKNFKKLLNRKYGNDI